MIQGVEIINFQSHKSTKLLFHPGVNIIVGKSDGGKSAILRALCWAIFNKPAGNEFRSNWGGRTSVEVFTEEGSVVRIKDKAEEYIVRTPGRKDLSLKAFRTVVPDEVNNILQITDVNVQRQLDGPFLLSKSSSEVASYLNRIAKLDKIDLGIQNIQKSIREITQVLKHKRADRKVQRLKLKTFDYLDKAEMQMEVLEELDNQLHRLESSKDKLMDLLATYYDRRIQIDLQASILKHETTVTRILNLYERKEEIEKKKEKIDDLVIQVQEIQEEIAEKNKLITLENKVTTLLKLIEERDEAEFERLLLSKVQTNYKNIIQRIKTADLSYKQLCIKYNKEFPDICPLCGSKVPHDHQNLNI